MSKTALRESSAQTPRIQVPAAGFTVPAHNNARVGVNENALQPTASTSAATPKMNTRTPRTAATTPATIARPPSFSTEMELDQQDQHERMHHQRQHDAAKNGDHLGYIATSNGMFSHSDTSLDELSTAASQMARPASRLLESNKSAVPQPPAASVFPSAVARKPGSEADVSLEAVTAPKNAISAAGENSKETSEVAAVRPEECVSLAAPTTGEKAYTTVVVPVHNVSVSTTQAAVVTATEAVLRRSINVDLPKSPGKTLAVAPVNTVRYAAAATTCARAMVGSKEIAEGTLPVGVEETEMPMAKSAARRTLSKVLAAAVDSSPSSIIPASNDGSPLGENPPATVEVVKAVPPLFTPVLATPSPSPAAATLSVPNPAILAAFVPRSPSNGTPSGKNMVQEELQQRQEERGVLEGGGEETRYNSPLIGHGEELEESTFVPSAFRVASDGPMRRWTSRDLFWQQDKFIGGGTFATVVVARTHGGAKIAVKAIARRMPEHGDQDKYIDRELELLGECAAHPNVVDLLGNIKTLTTVFLLMPLATTDVAHLIETEPLPEAQVVHIVRQLCSATEYLHLKKIVHRDVKPDNLLVSGDNILLADFGVAKRIEDEEGYLTGVAGTKPYLAPEQVSDKPYTTKADMWAVGVVVYEILHGRRPFSPDSMTSSVEPPESSKDSDDDDSCSGADSESSSDSDAGDIADDETKGMRSACLSSTSCIPDIINNNNPLAFGNSDNDHGSLCQNPVVALEESSTVTMTDSQERQAPPTMGSEEGLRGEVRAPAVREGAGPFLGGGAGMQGGIEMIYDDYDTRERACIVAGAYVVRPERVSAAGADFIADLLQVSPDYRASAVQASEHRWLGGLAAATQSRKLAAANIEERSREQAAERKERCKRLRRGVRKPTRLTATESKTISRPSTCNSSRTGTPGMTSAAGVIGAPAVVAAAGGPGFAVAAASVGGDRQGSA